MADGLHEHVGDPSQQFEELKKALEEQITATFPIRDKSGKFEVRLRDVQTVDKLGVEDIKEQQKRRVEGRSWSAPVSGTVEVVDTATNKVLVSRRQRITEIPKMTRHFSWIIDGQEMSLMNQWRLRPGAYVKAMEKPGEFEAQFQLAKGKSFDLQQEEKGHLFMKVGGRKVPLYSVLKAEGVSDEQMKSAWGEAAYNESLKRAKPKDLQSLYEAWKGSPAPAGTDFAKAVPELLQQSQLDPEIAHQNLGVRSAAVNGQMLLAASKKLMNVSAGKETADPIDSLRYKELWTAKDHMVERLARSGKDITARVQSAFRKPTLVRKILEGDSAALRDVVAPDLLRKPMFYPFTSTSLASVSNQTNPISMLGDRSATTIMGPGGIKSDFQLNASNTAIDPSHLGYLDPVFTPESNPGVTTHLSYGVRPSTDRKPLATLYNLRTGKLEHVDAARAAASNIVLPDQVTWKGGKPSPRVERFRMVDGKGELRNDLHWNQADYVIPSTNQVFSLETNFVPFMQNDSAGRTTMSARHMAQAISIVGREAPMVRVEATPGKSFEEAVGKTFLGHTSPVNGKVVKVGKNEITVADAQGKTHAVHLYDHYPTNNTKGMLHSTPLVQVGQSVKQGQTVADNNYTKNGTLALGTNLRTAYLANGMNHEDGIVISESAAKKLMSEHLLKPEHYAGENIHVDKKRFIMQKPGLFTPERLEKINDDGTIKVGAKVKPGDPLILALKQTKGPTGITADSMQRLGAKLRNPFGSDALTWDHPYEGEVVSVHKNGRTTTVHIKTLEPAQVGSKVSTRHSAKGIVTQIMPDDEMPVNEHGRHVEMLINPVSVPGRNNPGQILETAAGRIAEKTGKPYLVKNFEGGVDYLAKIQKELKQHGLKDTDTLYDPKTGRKLGEVMVGPHYAFQLEHQIDKKTHVRSGGKVPKQYEAPQLHYDGDTKIPRGGGHTGAQSLGSLGIGAALASGLHDNLREMATLKSDEPQAKEVWGALMNGLRLPPPQVPFAYKKFENLLQGMGVNLEKSATSVRIIPRSDAETRKLSRGEIKRPTRGIRAKDDAPEKDGIFDPTVTGGPGASGQHWGHIELVESVPHPVYATPIAQAMGIKPNDIPDILSGKKNWNGLVGSKAFTTALKSYSVEAEMKKLQTQLADPKIKETPLNQANQQYKALRVLKELGKKPQEAWMIKAVPVLPPVYRPISTMPDGTVRSSPLNSLYRRLGMVNESLKSSDKGGVPWNSTLDTRAGLYQELSNLFGTTPKGKKALDLDMRGTKEDRSKKLPGIIHMIAGESPKDGFFQDKLIGKKQDYSARATIVGDPNLSMEEVGVPKKLAVELMRPMVVRRLMAAGKNAEQANLMVSKRDPLAFAALAEEVKHRPVLLKRDPVLHQYGLVGQNVKLIDSEAIKISPLIMPPLNADIDGDTVSLYVPLTPGAVEEVKRVVPSSRTLSDSSGDVLYTPTNEGALALYRATLARKRLNKSFASKDVLEDAFKKNQVDLDHIVHVKGVGDTTLGRMRIAAVVPEQYSKSILTDLDKPFDRKAQSKLLKEVAVQQPKHFVGVADNLSRLGFQMAYDSGHTVSLKDLQPLRGPRDAIINAAQKKVDQLKGRDPEVSKQVWLNATQKLHDTYKAHFSKAPTNVSDMADAGIKAKAEQFQGLVMAPMLVEDHKGNAGRVPITRSFSEGVDIGGYFLQASGARRGVIQKTDAVREPGYMSKLLVQSTIDQPVTAHDCGTGHGIALSIRDKDIIDRHLAQPIKLGKVTHAVGAVVTPEMQNAAVKENVGMLVVRSPLKCRMPQGVCSVCMGVHPSGAHYQVGENAGLISAQALGERAAQLMLKQTHGGGIVSLNPHTVADFEDVQRMFNAAKRSREEALLAPKDSKVTKVQKMPQGSYMIELDNKKSLVSRMAPSVTVGQQVRKGQMLTAGEANVHDVLATQGHEAAQAHMVRRIGDIYANEGVLRRHSELTVRNMMGMVRVTDTGDHNAVVRGDYMMRNAVDEMNRRNANKTPVKYQTVLKPVESIPMKRNPDWMARLGSENLAKSMLQAAQHGETSRFDSHHPLPALAQGASYNLHPKVTR